MASALGIENENKKYKAIRGITGLKDNWDNSYNLYSNN